MDIFEEGKLKTSVDNLKMEFTGSDKLRFISIASNKSSIDNNKREFITSIITNNGVSQYRWVDDGDLKLGEASMANQERRIIEGQATDLAVFVQNEGTICSNFHIRKYDRVAEK